MTDEADNPVPNDSGPSEWVEKVLLAKFKSVRRKRKAALDFSDPEGVHDMRVATRRLRSALRDFGLLFAGARFGKVRRDLKRLADALGAVRDQDVAIAALEKFRGEAPDEAVRTGIERLIEDRSADRDRSRERLEEAITRKSLKKVSKKLKRSIGRLADASDGPGFCEAGAQVIGRARQEFLSLTPHLSDPDAREELHRLRIVAKRLRYALELFEDCGLRGEGLNDPDELARIQTCLGEFHDCDVWIASLRRSEEVSAATDWLLLRFTEKRSVEYRAAVGQWEKMCDIR